MSCFCIPKDRALLALKMLHFLRNLLYKINISQPKLYNLQWTTEGTKSLTEYSKPSTL